MHHQLQMSVCLAADGHAVRGEHGEGSLLRSADHARTEHHGIEVLRLRAVL